MAPLLPHAPSTHSHHLPLYVSRCLRAARSALFIHLHLLARFAAAPLLALGLPLWLARTSASHRTSSARAAGFLPRSRLLSAHAFHLLKRAARTSATRIALPPFYTGFLCRITCLGRRCLLALARLSFARLRTHLAGSHVAVFSCRASCLCARCAWINSVARMRGWHRAHARTPSLMSAFTSFDTQTTLALFIARSLANKRASVWFALFGLGIMLCSSWFDALSRVAPPSLAVCPHGSRIAWPQTCCRWPTSLAL